MTRRFTNAAAIFMALMSMLAGCGKKQSPPQEAPTAQPAPKQGGVENLLAPSAPDAAAPPSPGAAPQPDNPPQQAAEKEPAVHPLDARDVAMLNYAVSQFREAKGRNPNSLQEMVQARFLPRIPQTDPSERLVYDPNTGKMKVEKIK